MKTLVLDRFETPHSKACIVILLKIEGARLPKRFLVSVENDTHSFNSEQDARDFFNTITDPLKTIFAAITNGTEQVKRAKVKHFVNGNQQ